jgi:hypothetical protein
VLNQDSAPIFGLALAFVLVFLYQLSREDEDKYSATWWGQSIGATFGIGFIIFTPILFFIL